MKDAGNTRVGERTRLAVNEAVKALFDSEDFPSEADRRFDDSADHRIQGRAVSTARIPIRIKHAKKK